MGNSNHFYNKMRNDLCRLARFGANLADAYSCLIFLPSHLLGNANTNAELDMLELAGFHSLSNDLLRDTRVPAGTGLIGWVAKHNRAIHVSPFDRDSTTLGIYGSDQLLKSFIGIPVPIAKGRSQAEQLTGVIACDSKKSFAFSKLQGKLLENLASEISNTISLLLELRNNGEESASWADFIKQATHFVDALGVTSVEVLRIRPKNLVELEARFGTAACLELIEQVYRLIRQTLPPHFPIFKLPTGDLIIVIDNMMGGFLQNKIWALCKHVTYENYSIEFEYIKRSFKEKRYRSLTLEKLITDSCMTEYLPEQTTLTPRGESYEYRRA